jgi:hypothetical protein
MDMRMGKRRGVCIALRVVRQRDVFKVPEGPGTKNDCAGEGRK